MSKIVFDCENRMRFYKSKRALKCLAQLKLPFAMRLSKHTKKRLDYCLGIKKKMAFSILSRFQRTGQRDALQQGGCFHNSDRNAREARGTLSVGSCVIDKHNFSRFGWQPHFFEAASVTYNAMELRGSWTRKKWLCGIAPMKSVTDESRMHGRLWIQHLDCLHSWTLLQRPTSSKLFVANAWSKFDSQSW